MGLVPGDLIDDKYRIVRLIGEGGMGAVYEGENTRIHRRVAIKVLHANVVGMTDVVARFEREAQAAGRIGSEHIVEVLDLGTLSSGDRYLVMEFMDGDSLSQRISERGRLQPVELYPIARQLLEALIAAHKAGIVHRDLKPDNVFLLRSRRGQPDFAKLLDFGISKFGGSGSGLSMTRTGAVMGTPYYMAPEQAKGSRDVDHRVDLYAVGVILYEALAGQVPFVADTFNELLFKIVLEKPPPLAELAPEIDPEFAQIVAKAMAREPAERYQSALELQQALDDWAARAGHSAHSTGAYPASQERPPTLRTPLATAPLAATPGTWSGTHADAAPMPEKPKPSRAGLVASIAGIALLAGGSGVFMIVSSKTPTAVPSSGVTSGSTAAPPIEPMVTSPAPALAPSSDAKPPVVELSPTPPAPAPIPAKPSTARAVRAAPARVAPAARPAAVPTPAPAKPAEPASPQGRKIRQTL